MPNVKCAIAGEELDQKKAYCCPRCKMWLCYKHTDRGLMGIGEAKCPHCGTKLE